ncbi:MAG: hypothetical protein IAE94_01500 [Chthoniobacterales bacterium]|nr:hypothetical protein [Chthoniobacterales bacterium]
MKFAGIFLLLLGGLCLAWAADPDARVGESAAAAARPLAGLFGESGTDSFRKSVSKIADLQVFEGLPDPRTHPMLFTAENSREEVIRIEGGSFYKNPLALNEVELAELRAIFYPGNPFSPGGGQDPCGRFHPDFVVVWREKDSVYYALIGLGCQEIEAVSGTRRLHHYVPPDIYARLNRLLGKHARNRPEEIP